MSEIPKPGASKEVAASELKNAWHAHLDRVREAREEFIVTRYGKPVAKLVPYDEGEGSGGIFGYLAGTLTVHEDIIAPIDAVWEADA